VKIEDKTFSKSRGYVVWTNDDYLDMGLPADYLRYYLLSYTSHTKELNFSWQVFQDRINNELVDTLGNFLYRTLHFAGKKLGGIPDREADPEILAAIARCRDEVDAAMRAYEFKNAIDAMMALASFGNGYIQNNAPWKLLKEDRDEAEQVIRNALQLAKALALLFASVIPEKAQAAWESLGYSDAISAHGLPEAMEGFGFSDLPAPAILFEKLDDDRIAELEKILVKRVEEAKMKEEGQEQISIDEFGKMDLRVGLITAAEPIKGSKKLLKLQVDIGSEKRQVVSGIAQFYGVDDLVGTRVILVANLKPVKIFGVESRGMILAAGDEASLLVPLRDVEPGTRVC
jgi:methionyl-tRNA synthetase